MEEKEEMMEGKETTGGGADSVAVATAETGVGAVQENVLRRHIRDDPKKALLAQHKAWLNDIQHEFPMPYIPYKIGVYIRFFNQTRYENYLEKHIQQLP